MPEFGAFPYTESVAHGHTRNPWRTSFSPGGSSGGSAVAVASGMVPVAMGGDGGGSIRIPSACCGLFGLKPQRGRVTSAPHAHLWWALGVAGAAHPDGPRLGDRERRDPRPPPRRPLAGGRGRLVHRGRRSRARPVADRVEHEATDEGDPAARRPRVRRTRHRTAALGPRPRGARDRPALPRHRPPRSCRSSSPASGARPGRSSTTSDSSDVPARATASARGSRPKVIDAALRSTERVSAKANRVFDNVDVLLTPTMAQRPPRLGILDRTGTVRASLRSLPAVSYAALWNVAGNPACSVPAGTGTDGLPGRRPAGRPHRRRGGAVQPGRPARAGPAVAAGGAVTPVTGRRRPGLPGRRARLRCR